MNRLLITLSAFVVTLILAVAIFGAFFSHNNNVQARAFVVIKPLNTLETATLDAVTQMTATLADTYKFKARIVSDLIEGEFTALDVMITQDDIENMHIQKDTAGLVSISVSMNDSLQARDVATHGAHMIATLLEKYYPSQYAFTVIDGVIVKHASRVSVMQGILLSIAISALTTTLVFLVIFSIHGARRTHPTRPHGTIHASHAALNLKTPHYRRTQHYTQNKDDVDYMRDMYAAYDASLEKLLQTDNTSFATQQKTAMARKQNDDRSRNESSGEVRKNVTREDTQDTKKKVMQKQEKGVRKKVQEHKSVQSQRADIQKEEVVPTRNEQKEQLKTPKTQKKQTKTAQESAHSVQKEEVHQKTISTTPRTTAATHAAPANLPIMDNDGNAFLASVKAAKKKFEEKTNTRTKDAAAETAPTPDEVRKRLNELLSGKPPKITP